MRDELRHHVAIHIDYMSYMCCTLAALRLCGNSMRMQMRRI